MVSCAHFLRNTAKVQNMEYLQLHDLPPSDGTQFFVCMSVNIH